MTGISGRVKMKDSSGGYKNEEKKNEKASESLF
jgi:hypothetical protein